MKIWRFIDPFDFRFAQGGRRGTWSPSKGLCPECTASSQKRIKPLLVEWAAGSDIIGDFTDVAFSSDFVITDRVARSLEPFGGFECGPVEIVPPKSSRKNSSTRRHGRPRVPFPYEGPPLHELWVRREVNLDLRRSSVWLTDQCTTCGAKNYEVDGVEKRTVSWDADEGRLLEHHFPRVSGKGFYLDGAVLEGDAIFRAAEAPAWVLCLDTVKELVLSCNFTNIEFLEMGEITSR